MGKKKELVLNSVEELNEYLREKGNGRTVISVILELAENQKKKGGREDGRGV